MNQICTKTISPSSLSEFLSSGGPHELLDVRMPPEYFSAHVPGATLIPLNELKAEAVVAGHRAGVPMFVLCQAGSRAAKAIEELERAGCEDCVLVEGGTQAWMDAGLPVHRSARKVLPLVRQVHITVGSLTAISGTLGLVVNRWFGVLPVLFGCGLLFAGITGTCGMALMLAKMPWNREQSRCMDCGNGEGL